jgi:NAD(P)-dependent dehydrogenase (short-subunit alcohol dehydrogenase family)
MTGARSTFAVVTAGASGIGRVVAQALIDDGWRVLVTDIDEQAGERTAAETGCTFFPCDMGDPDAIRAVFAAVPPVGLLVNNAGIAGPTLPVADAPVEDWRRTLDVNLTAQFVAAQCVLPGMIAARHGVIVNMASVAARIGYPNRAAYAASKWGVLGFTASLAREVGEAGIRVNAILPGSVRGERIENVVAAYAEKNAVPIAEAEAYYLARAATRRFVEPEEIAAMVLYLASDAARSITGQFIGVDGGFE